MAKKLSLVLVVLFVAFEECLACTVNSDCRTDVYGENPHCCSDYGCYNQYTPCPTADDSTESTGVSAGLIVAVVLGGIAGIGIKIALYVFCCRRVCWRPTTRVIVTQPPYQQFGVSTVTTTTSPCPQPPPSQGYGYPPPHQQHGYPPAPPPQYTERPPTTESH